MYNEASRDSCWMSNNQCVNFDIGRTIIKEAKNTGINTFAFIFSYMSSILEAPPPSRKKYTLDLYKFLS